MESDASHLLNDPSFSTHSIHVGSESEKWANREVVPPISLSTIYQQQIPPNHKGYRYTRGGNPTRDSLESCLAKLDRTKFCIALPSGMCAAYLVTKLLRKGDHVIVQDDIYHGILNMFRTLNEETDEIEVTFVDGQSQHRIQSALRPSTKLVWLETPTNPLLKVVDLRKMTSLVRTIAPCALIACDNTFLSPYFQRPAELGVDIVMQSCTKYIGGHSDVLMGALCLNDREVYEKLRKKQVMVGLVPSPFDCYLVLRSLKTLEIRMQRHMSNGLEVASFLQGHPMVEKVFHPRLPSHQHYELSLQQCSGHSGVFSFYIKGHDKETTKKFLGRLQLIQIATSLGGAESVIKMPSQMPPGALKEEEKRAQGITDGLLRLSAGLENSRDLIDDLKQALNNL